MDGIFAKSKLAELWRTHFSGLTQPKAEPDPEATVSTKKIHTIFLETITRCNLRCTYCHRTDNTYRSKNTKMAFPAFKTIIDKIDTTHHLFGAAKPAIWLHGYGEPTLHPELAQQIAYASHSGKFREVRIVSNLLATSKEAYDGYFAAGLSHLYVSFDTLDTDIIAKTRVGTDPVRYDETIRYLAANHGEKLRVITVLSPSNLPTIGEVFAYLKGLGIKQWIIQLMFDHGAQEFAISPKDVESLQSIIADKGDMKIFAEGFPYPKCTQPDDTLVIGVSGNISACCTYFAEEYISNGNALRENPLEVFESDRFNLFRKEFQDRTHSLCSTCPMWGPPVNGLAEATQ